MTTYVIIRHIEAKVVVWCPRIADGEVVESAPAPEPITEVQIACIADGIEKVAHHAIPVWKHRNASEIIQAAIDVAVSDFGGNPDDVVVLNGHCSEIPVERILIDLPDGRQKKGVAVKERFLPLREARAALLGIDGVAEALKAYNAK